MALIPKSKIKLQQANQIGVLKECVQITLKLFKDIFNAFKHDGVRNEDRFNKELVAETIKLG